MHDPVTIIDTIESATHDMSEPLSTQIRAEYGKDPFIHLISCLLSLRAKDTKTIGVARALFLRARTPAQIVNLSLPELEKIIYSIGFYKQKARTLKRVSAQLLEQFGGKVPRTQAELLQLDGVGHKTANLVLSMAFDIPAICVDVHVHRLANILGLVKTRTPEETERALEKILPKSYWIKTNEILVKLGQNIRKVTPQLPKKLQQRLAPLLHRK